MPIPKKIHYCWFGGNELPEIAINCIASWKKYCPDYEIIRWDEINSDLESCQFIKEAYAEKKWAFVSDYMRLKVVEEFGGIYLDIDVELLKSLDGFLSFDGFMSFEQAAHYCVNTGLGFGAIKGHPIIKLLMNNYEKSVFIQVDGGLDMTPCPIRDTRVLRSLGLVQKNKMQLIDGMCIFPTDYFCPVSGIGEQNFTNNTVSIHHYNGSWLTENHIKKIDRKKKIVNIFGPKIGVVINYTFAALDELIETGLIGAVKKIVKFLIRIIWR